MKIYALTKDKSLWCCFNGHEFHLTRNTEDKFSFGNWFANIATDDGDVVFDDWLDDSSSYTVKQAMIHACTSASIEPPKNWGTINNV